MRIQFFFLVIALSGALPTNIPTNILSDEFINHINNQQSTWTAGRNFKENTPLSHLYGLVGSRSSPKAIPMNVHVHSENVGIPESFDARENWPRCESIKVIKDQSACGSCWAVATTSMMSDRICIHSNGNKQIFVSDEDLISCCDHCGVGCVGGFPWEALHWWHTEGIVSGGPYNSTVGCKAYSMPPCDHLSIGTKPECPDEPYDTPECQKQCDPQSSLSYNSDKSFGQEPYGVNADGNLTRAQLDILINGPIVASFQLYEDFFSYKSEGLILLVHVLETEGLRISAS
ncbi:cathepsin B isoform X2 [Leptinotarsa decemlineata]|uniref:cathepsin B isoform X2 n=1 Tax=Leptinotarsa decemlineata TaxID=7539 RepID=UPI003D30716D